MEICGASKGTKGATESVATGDVIRPAGLPPGE